MAGNATFVSASTSSSELMFSGSYLNGQRGPSVDRSRNYREGSESRMLGLGFAVPRGGSSSVAASDGIHTLSQCISLEPIVIPRPVSWCDELQRVLGSSTGSTAEENTLRAAATYVKPLSLRADLKDLRRLKLNVEDARFKARVRADRIDERLRKLDRYCEHVASKKQKRNESTSIDRAGALNPKAGTEIYGINQRVEDRPKNILLNKRFRTTVTDSQAKDGNLPEDIVGESDLFVKIPRLAAGGEGWDKKGKRRRSIGTIPPRPVDNGGVPKRAVQNKLVVENGLQPCDPQLHRLNNGERPMPSGLSSPPMATQWGGQRPKKIARVRRPFPVSVPSNQDEKRLSFESSSPSDVGASARLTSAGANGSHAPKIAASSPKKFVVKFDNVQSSPRLSESQQSVGGQSRSIDKDIENRENKNKPFRNSATQKPIQSRKTGHKKNRSKPGRRLKKLSDRKGFVHPSPSQTVSSPDCTVASDDDRDELLEAVNHARSAAHLACKNPFWKKMEPVFGPVSSEDKSFLSQQVDSISDPLLSENESFDADKTSKESIPLYQRVLSALIIENDFDTPEDGDTRAMQFPNPFSVPTYDDTHNVDDSSYENMCLADKLLLELKSIGVCPDNLPVLEDDENETIQKEIYELNTRLHQQEAKKKAHLQKISKDVNCNNSRELETLAMDRLVEVSYKKLLGSRRSSRSGIQKVPKQAALAFGKRTLVRCRKFENSGTSCFNEAVCQDILSAPVTRPNPSDEASPINASLSNRGRKKEVSLDHISTTRRTSANAKQKNGKRSENKHTGTTHPTGPARMSSANRAVDELEPLDEMVAGGDLGGAHDLTSFLNFDDQDLEVDFAAGLDIPMDDLAELF